jgi:hypothetical protein
MMERNIKTGIDKDLDKLKHGKCADWNICTLIIQDSQVIHKLIGIVGNDVN